MGLNLSLTITLVAIVAGQQIEGKDGVLMPLIKQLVEASLKAELSHHLDKEIKPNRKNGTTKKSLKTLGGTIEIETPRDRAGSRLRSILT